ncbi:MAG TPA: polyphosphate kinase 1 [Pyrinomonadaceae bacterium]|nr:polyphosphate kinase 1 [Pyrinomonadaceae bacterium]
MSTAITKEVPATEIHSVGMVAAERQAEFQEDSFINRELSLLEFHRRVLEEALDETNPLLERLKFLSIFASNIDEFFMIRVSGLKEEVDENVTELSPDGLTPSEQLAEIRNHLLPMIDEQMRCLRENIFPQLAAEGIDIVSFESLTRREKQNLDRYFVDKVFPILTPLAVDPTHPFPYISPLSLNIGLVVQAPDEPSPADPPKFKNEPRFVRIKVPSVFPRLVPVRDGENKFVLLEDLIRANIQLLFPGMDTGNCHLFRVTRDADIEIREEEAEDLLRVIQQELRKRRFGSPVRLEVSSDMPEVLIHYLTQSLDLLSEDVYKVDGPLAIQDLMSLYELDRPDLKDEPFVPRKNERFESGKSIFDAIKEGDVLVHHPYDSYDCVTDFINQAVDDPDVLAIKICLYRTGPDSPIPPALIRASEKGKQVTALIELKARFDEEHNIEWARKLDRAGVHVVYGIIGLKTHGKLTLVVRREGDGLKRYMHIASGNYNPTTSCTYTDLGLFTADEQIGADATELFNYLTGSSRQTEYRKLFVAPVNMRTKIDELIDREIEHHKVGRPARIALKVNRLADTRMIAKLYEASRAGVGIDLIVRGICMLRPGVPGLSETITVKSVVGRFLEHSRIFYFANGGDDELYIGSADLMSRNLKHRIEVLAPIRDRALKSHLKNVVLTSYLRDNVKARELRADGVFVRIRRPDNEERFNSQECFIHAAPDSYPASLIRSESHNGGSGH